MSEHTFWKSRTMLKRNLVRLIDKSDDYFYFEVKGYKVKYARNQRGKTSCTCQHGSIWGVGKDCSHIESCKRWIKGEDL